MSRDDDANSSIIMMIIAPNAPCRVVMTPIMETANCIDNNYESFLISHQRGFYCLPRIRRDRGAASNFIATIAAVMGL